MMYANIRNGRELSKGKQIIKAVNLMQLGAEAPAGANEQ